MSPKWHDEHLEALTDQVAAAHEVWAEAAAALVNATKQAGIDAAAESEVVRDAQDQLKAKKNALAFRNNASLATALSTIQFLARSVHDHNTTNGDGVVDKELLRSNIAFLNQLADTLGLSEAMSADSWQPLLKVWYGSAISIWHPFGILSLVVVAFWALTVLVFLFFWWLS